MSEPTIQELQADGYELARQRCIEFYGREPTKEELEVEYEFLCEKYRY